jgi:hypothetical protein
LILFGPEVRSFLYSGLAEGLARHGRVSVIAANPASAAFSTFGPFATSGEGQVHPAPRTVPSYPLERFRRWKRRLHKAWLTTQRQVRRPHGGPRPGEDTFDPGADPSETNCPRWLRAAHRMQRSMACLSGPGKTWARLYDQLRLDCLIAADYASPGAVTALLAAARKNVTTVVLTNSWKDVYVHPYIDVLPDWIGVAGQVEADQLRRTNPHLDARRIGVTGSLHLERFLRPGAITGRAEFCRRAGLDPARPFVCYTAAAPRAVSDEESIVRMLLEATEHHAVRPQILLRLNPREDGERFRHLQVRFAHCFVQKPRWEWDPQNDWNAPLPEDLDTWVATVHHSAFNVSVPSTVTLEFTAMGRLTLNVCFGADGRSRAALNARYWDAPFYRQIRRSPLVAGAFSVGEFRELLACRLGERGAWRLSPPRNVVAPVEAAERLIRAAVVSRHGSE